MTSYMFIMFIQVSSIFITKMTKWRRLRHVAGHVPSGLVPRPGGALRSSSLRADTRGFRVNLTGKEREGRLGGTILNRKLPLLNTFEG